MKAMYKSIQAFFKTEDDAESAKATLNKLKTNDILVDELPDGGGTMTVVPLGYSGNSTHGLGAGHGGIIAPIAFTGEVNPDDDNAPRNFMVDVQVEEADFQEALRVIMEKDGRVSKDLFDN